MRLSRMPALVRLFGLNDLVSVRQIGNFTQHHTYRTIARLGQLNRPFNRFWTYVMTREDVLDSDIRKHQGIRFRTYPLDTYLVVLDHLLLL